jgi:hypothetical protein
MQSIDDRCLLRPAGVCRAQFPSSIVPTPEMTIYPSMPTNIVCDPSAPSTPSHHRQVMATTVIIGPSCLRSTGSSMIMNPDQRIDADLGEHAGEQGGNT